MPVRSTLIYPYLYKNPVYDSANIYKNNLENIFNNRLYALEYTLNDDIVLGIEGARCDILPSWERMSEMV